MHDFETWLPKLKRDAIILLHDTQVSEFGVWRVWEELKLRFANALFFEFQHSFGLGVIVLEPDISLEKHL